MVPSGLPSFTATSETVEPAANNAINSRSSFNAKRLRGLRCAAILFGLRLQPEIDQAADGHRRRFSLAESGKVLPCPAYFLCLSERASALEGNPCYERQEHRGRSSS